MTVHRSDSSGTTWIFTHYLKAVDFVVAVRRHDRPLARRHRREGQSRGVANAVKSKSGAIGYVEYCVRRHGHIAYAQMKNRSGKWVLPSTSTFAAAGAHAKYTWSNGFATSLVNMKGAKAWPITGETYILVRRSQKSYATGQRHARVLQLGAHQQHGHRGRQGSQLRAAAEGRGQGDQEGLALQRQGRQQALLVTWRQSKGLRCDRSRAGSPLPGGSTPG